MASDSAFDYGPDSFDAKDSQPDDLFSIDLLISHVEEMQRREQLEALQKLTLDNALLQQVVIDYQEHWCWTLHLLEKSQEALLSMQKALEHCVNESAAAERGWLAFWGIKKEHVKLSKVSYSPAGWI